MIDHPYKEWEEDELPPIAGMSIQYSEGIGRYVRVVQKSKYPIKLQERHMRNLTLLCSDGLIVLW